MEIQAAGALPQYWELEELEFVAVLELDQCAVLVAEQNRLRGLGPLAEMLQLVGALGLGHYSVLAVEIHDVKVVLVQLVVILVVKPD